MTTRFLIALAPLLLATTTGGAAWQPEPAAKPQAQPATKAPAQPETKPGDDFTVEPVGNNPGPVHQKLAKLVGEWETVSKFAIPGQAAAESKGSSKITSVLGGRFFSEEDRGTMMGQEFTSLKLWGYNTLSQKYEAVWTYTGSTSMMTMTGGSKDDGKSVVYEASYETMAGSREQMVITMKVVDDDHFTVSIAAKVPDGQQAPEFETAYTRKK